MQTQLVDIRKEIYLVFDIVLVDLLEIYGATMHVWRESVCVIDVRTLSQRAE